jgi:ankyrin repeat protein
MKGLTNTVKILLQNGARLDMVNRDGWNALHLAVKEGSERPSAFGSNVFANRLTDRDNLIIGFNELSRYLIDKYPAATLSVSKSGRLPVQTAARCNEDTYLTLYLLTHSPNSPKAILNHQDNSGQNLLQDAVAAKNIPLVRTLIEDYEANANVPDMLGRTAIHHAAMIGCVDVMVVLRDLERRKITFIDWDRADSWDEWTPLMHAAREGHSEASKFLIEECRADCSKQDKQGRTPGDIGKSDGIARLGIFYGVCPG